MGASAILTSRDAARLQGKSISATAPTDGQVLAYQASSGLWLPQALTSLGSGIAAANGTPVAVSSAADGQSLTIPAGALAATGDALWIVASGVCSGGTGGVSLNLALHFGATKLLDYNFPNTVGAVQMAALVIRTGAASQIATCSMLLHTGVHLVVQATTPAETMSGAIVLKTAVNSYTDGTVTYNTLAYQVVRKAP